MELGRFDTETQMFVEPVHDVDMPHLRFHRWIAEREGRSISTPRGENLFRLSNPEIKRYAMIEADSKLPITLAIKEHIAKTGGY